MTAPLAQGDGWRVTAAPRTGPAGHAAAAEVARGLKLPLVRRGNQSMAALRRTHGAGGWLVVHPTHGLRAVTPQGVAWRWHPGLARTRVASAETDHLLRALDGAQRLVDANLGQGHDALVAAAGGCDVLGLEVQPVVHALTHDGLARCRDPLLAEAASRVTTRCADHAAWLRSAAPGCVDAVLFSPMYVDPRFRAEDLVQLREAAAPGWPSPETLRHALRVARVVVVKVEPGRHPPLPPVAAWFGGRRRVAWARLARGT